jgi:transcriptional regulator with XRE-family HTH domain
MKPHPIMLWRHRHEPPLSQRQAATELGVTHAAISRWEDGTRIIDLNVAIAIAKKTGISINELRPDLHAIFKAAGDE